MQTELIQEAKRYYCQWNSAKRLYGTIQMVLIKGYMKYEYTILDFRVKEISPDYLMVGCHKTPMEEVYGIASLLGWE